jgi:hypothetical protein
LSTSAQSSDEGGRSKRARSQAPPQVVPEHIVLDDSDAEVGQIHSMFTFIILLFTKA